MTENLKIKELNHRNTDIILLIMDSVKSISKGMESVANGKDGCVFLIDDNPVFLTVLENEVKEIFPLAKVKCFATGEEALSGIHKGNKENPFLVFLDYDLAGASAKLMNGISVLKKIKREAPETEVVMLSGIRNLNIVTTSMKNGAFDYIVKGENAINDIHNGITNVLRRIRVREEQREYYRVKLFLKWTMFLILIFLLVAIYNYSTSS